MFKHRVFILVFSVLILFISGCEPEKPSTESGVPVSSEKSLKQSKASGEVKAPVKEVDSPEKPEQKKKQFIVQLDTGHSSGFGPGKSAFALTKNGVINKLPPQARIIRDLAIINSIVVEAETAEELQVEGVLKVEEDTDVEVHLQESVPQIGANQAHDLGITGEGVSIAIIDTGVDYNHPDIAPQYAGGYDIFDNDPDPKDEYGHGSHVAGIALGGAPKADIYGVKVFGPSGSTATSNIIKGIEWTMDPDGNGDTSDRLDVANMSLGGPGMPDDLLCQAVAASTQVGTIHVVSAGNSGSSGSIRTPGMCPDSITVAANTKGDPPQIAGFSSQGPILWFGGGLDLKKPDLSAPGVDICAALGENTSYESKPICVSSPKRISLSGTSMSSPHIAGVVALVKQKRPSVTTEEVRRILIATAEPFPYEPESPNDSPFWWDAQGAGEVDALASVQLDEIPPAPTTQVHPSAVFISIATPGDYPVSISYSGDSVEPVIEGYQNISLPNPVTDDFTLVFSAASGITPGAHQAKIFLGDVSIIILAMADFTAPDAPQLLYTDQFEQGDKWEVHTKWNYKDDACIRVMRMNVPTPEGTTTLYPLVFSSLPEINGPCYPEVNWRYKANNIPAGEYEIFAETEDIVGNVTRSPSQFLTVGEVQPPTPTPTPPPPEDTVPPTLEITSPVDGYTVPRKSTFYVYANASDNVGVAFVQFGEDASCSVTQPPYRCSVSTKGKPNAAYHISAYAEDASGNRSDVSHITVYSEGNK